MSGLDDKTRVGAILKDLGISGQQLQGIKLGPGIVGRNTSIAWTCQVVMLAGAIGSIIEHSVPLLALSIIVAAVVALAIGMSNVYFGTKDPAAALLEGAQFLEYKHLQMATKDRAAIEASPPGPAPPALPSTQADAADEGQ